MNTLIKYILKMHSSYYFFIKLNLMIIINVAEDIHKYNLYSSI